MTIPPQTNEFKFESYLVEANKLKQQMFSTQEHKELDVQVNLKVQQIMDSDDHKEVEVKTEPKWPHEEYFTQQLLDWEEERKQAKLRAEEEARHLAEEEAKRIEAEKQAERERREAEGLPPLSEDEIQEKPAEQEGEKKESEGKLQSRESKGRPSTTHEEEEDMEYVEEKVRYDFRPSDQFGYLSIVEEPINRNWKY